MRPGITQHAALDRTGPAGRWWPVAGEIALIFLVFFLQAGWPVPDVNEAHYLSKARHYWDPAWCRHDFFCNTADAHQLFYWTCGWLTRWMSLPAAAWSGRVLIWLLLAAGWYRLSTAVVAAGLYAVLSAALFVALNDHCQMAGEWVVGGVEAKGIAYAFVFFALGEMLRGRWTRTWLLLGAATAFHVLVGGWSLVAAGLAWLAAGSERPALHRTLPAWGGAMLLALPGLLPAAALTWHVPPETVAAANRIYVFERLSHHLVFTAFPPDAVLRFGLLLLLGGVLVYVQPRTAALRRLGWFVTGSLLLAGAGGFLSVGLGAHESLAAGLLRFYWFRLADAMLPAGVALASVSYIAVARRVAPVWSAGCLLLSICAAGTHVGDVLQTRLTYASPRSDWTLDDPESWWEICDWIAGNTPPDAVFLTPRMAATFRWYTNRAEVANKKDVPQDAAGLVQWWQRMEDLYSLPGDPQPATMSQPPPQWRASLVSLGEEQLVRLGRKYGAEFVVTAAYPPLRLPKISPPNETYAVYRLPAREATPESAAPPVTPTPPEPPAGRSLQER